MDVARIHAENAIRQKNQAVNYLRMSARVDAVASRVQSALTTRKVTGSMAGVVKAMDAAMKGMNLEKISSAKIRNALSFVAKPGVITQKLLKQGVVISSVPLRNHSTERS